MDWIYPTQFISLTVIQRLQAFTQKFFFADFFLKIFLKICSKTSLFQATKKDKRVSAVKSKAKAMRLFNVGTALNIDAAWISVLYTHPADIL